MSDFGQAKFRCLANFIPSKYFVHGFKFFLSKSVREFVIVYSYCGHEAVLVCHTQFYSSLFTHTVGMNLSWYATPSSIRHYLLILWTWGCLGMPHPVLFVIIYSYCGHEAVLVCHIQFFLSFVNIFTMS